MSETLPPLAALRAFDAAARHLNFTRAGEELGMTQAAVSYQIKLLEERIGAALFVRQARRVALSEAGLRLAPGISQAFDMMRDSVAATRTGARSTLSISTMQTFASNWLAYYIGSFQLAHPNIAVRLDVNSSLTDFGRGDVDVAIRSGRGEWPGLIAHELVPAVFTPMMVPDLAARVKSPRDLLDLPLIGVEDPWWRVWFEAAGVDADLDHRGPALLLDSQVLVGSMALAGNGAAVLTPAFFTRELAEGRLVQPFDLVCSRGYAYWLVYPEARRNAPQIKAFRDWVLAEAERQRASAGVVRLVGDRTE